MPERRAPDALPELRTGRATAVSRDRAGLRDALEAALNRLAETGDYQRVLETWTSPVAPWRR